MWVELWGCGGLSWSVGSGFACLPWSIPDRGRHSRIASRSCFRGLAGSCLIDDRRQLIGSGVGSFARRFRLGLLGKSCVIIATSPKCVDPRPLRHASRRCSGSSTTPRTQRCACIDRAVGCSSAFSSREGGHAPTSPVGDRLPGRDYNTERYSSQRTADFPGPSFRQSSSSELPAVKTMTYRFCR